MLAEEAKLRILLVNTNHFRGGGDSTYTFNLADLLREKGHRVAFFAMQNERNFPDPNSDLFVSHIDFKEINRHKNPLTGIQVLTRVVYSKEARTKFGQVLDRFQPDLVHLQGLHAHITPSVIFEAKRRGLPVVWTLHDYKTICPNTHFLIDATGEVCEKCGRQQYYRALFSRCKKGSFLATGMAVIEAYAHWFMRVTDHVDAFLTPSAFLRNKLLERGFNPAKVHHLPLFLPEEMFKLSNGNEGYLLFLGKLEPIKGIRQLLEACHRVPDVKVILAGRVEEPLASELPRLMPPNAKYVGMVYGQELRVLLDNSLALVLPSLSYENQPFSILEAFACGKPAIASNLGGMTELVGSDRGLLVPPGDVTALAQAISWMAQHPDEAGKMGARARECALEVHTAERHLAGLTSVFENIGLHHRSVRGVPANRH